MANNVKADDLNNKNLALSLFERLEKDKRNSNMETLVANDLYEILECCNYAMQIKTVDRDFWIDTVSAKGKDYALKGLKYYWSQEYEDLYFGFLLFEAQNMIFDSYMLYLEKNRDYEERFYQPRRDCFLKIGLVQAMQDLLDDKIDILSISMPPGTGKSTLEKFFHSGICGWFPNDYNLFYSHSGDITRMYYDGLYDILTNTEEYTWNVIFPKCRVSSTNAKLEQININKYKPFPNVQCTSVGAKNAGKVRASKFLLCDDLIGGIEEALNKNQLDKLWSIYSVDAKQRKVTGCKELHIATRWSVNDVIGRLQRTYEGSERCRFIAIPDIDEKTGKSNFEFDVHPFTVEFYRDQELVMDDVSYRCLYKNQPIEREGLLYHDTELRRYLQLPLKEPDAIIGVCDTKAKGTDFFVLPVMYQYGNDYYMVDCICSDSSDFGYQYERIANIIMHHNMQQVEFEANSGGDRVAFEVENLVRAGGGRCNITSKLTETNKETRIIVNSNWIKRNVLFKDKSMYGKKDEYGIFMEWLLTYSVAGKNVHDDVCDAMANFALYVTRGSRVATAEAVYNPFWGKGFM